MKVKRCNICGWDQVNIRHAIETGCRNCVVKAFDKLEAAPQHYSYWIKNEFSEGATLINLERQRQVEDEGYGMGHDNEHSSGVLARAGATYALAYDHIGGECHFLEYFWPFGEDCWKPTPDDPVRQLVKAGALIAAEIDKLLYAKSHEDLAAGREYRATKKQESVEAAKDFVEFFPATSGCGKGTYRKREMVDLMVNGIPTKVKSFRADADYNECPELAHIVGIVIEIEADELPDAILGIVYGCHTPRAGRHEIKVKNRDYDIIYTDVRAFESSVTVAHSGVSSFAKLHANAAHWKRTGASV